MLWQEHRWLSWKMVLPLGCCSDCSYNVLHGTKPQRFFFSWKHQNQLENRSCNVCQSWNKNLQRLIKTVFRLCVSHKKTVSHSAVWTRSSQQPLWVMQCKRIVYKAFWRRRRKVGQHKLKLQYVFWRSKPIINAVAQNHNQHILCWWEQHNKIE